MSIITKMLKGTCVYWEANGTDGYGGRTFEDAIEISCRWENESVLFIDPEGNEVKSEALVYVNQDMVVGDYLCDCELTDLGAPSDNPQTVDYAREIRGFKKIPNFRYNEYIRVCYL